LSSIINNSLVPVRQQITTRAKDTLVDGFSLSTYTILSGQTSPNGLWKTEYANGSGAGVQSASGYGNVLWSQPQVSVSGNGLETNRNLVLSTTQFTDFNASFTMRTRQQLRQNFPVKVWERATFVWRYTDSNHYYYFVLKNVGCEVGKRDTSVSGDPNTILYTGDPFGPNASGQLWENITVFAEKNRHLISTSSSGGYTLNITDSSPSSSMAAGRVGMLADDSYDEWQSFNLG